jgi:hypothetical protein
VRDLSSWKEAERVVKVMQRSCSIEFEKKRIGGGNVIATVKTSDF